MKIFNFMGNSFGCSASGERLVSAARDGDLQEAKALLECNPRLAKYSTFGVRNSPLHYAAAQGHNEIVSLLLESGVDVNMRNYCGQTALMQACRYGHWEVVQTLILYKANVNKADYLNGRTAIHFAAGNGHSRCVRLLFAEAFPSNISFLHIIRGNVQNESVSSNAEYVTCFRIANKPADGGITALHLAALNGQTECVQLLLDLGANVSAVTVQDGSTVDLLGSGSTPLHYAACGGSTLCCQILISRGADRNAENVNRFTPLEVARFWQRHWLEGLLARGSHQVVVPSFPPSRYLALPLMSIVKIVRECGWRSTDPVPLGFEPCAVCLERRCAVAAEGCGHELCIRCALYLCSTNNMASTVSGPPGSIPCPMCRHGIVSFIKLPSIPSIKETGRSNMSLSLCTACSTEVSEPILMSSALCKGDYQGNRSSSLSNGSLRALICQPFPLTFQSGFCVRDPENRVTEADCEPERPEMIDEGCSATTTRIPGSTSSAQLVTSSTQSGTTQLGQSTERVHSSQVHISGSHVEGS